MNKNSILTLIFTTILISGCAAKLKDFSNGATDAATIEYNRDFSSYIQIENYKWGAISCSI